MRYVHRDHRQMLSSVPAVLAFTPQRKHTSRFVFLLCPGVRGSDTCVDVGQAVTVTGQIHINTTYLSTRETEGQTVRPLNTQQVRGSTAARSARANLGFLSLPGFGRRPCAQDTRKSLRRDRGDSAVAIECRLQGHWSLV